MSISWLLMATRLRPCATPLPAISLAAYAARLAAICYDSSIDAARCFFCAAYAELALLYGALPPPRRYDFQELMLRLPAAWLLMPPI